MTTLQLRLATALDARETMAGLYRQAIKPHTDAGGVGVLTWQTESTLLRLRMRGKFHGPVLRDISEQVWFTDPASGLLFRYAKPVWKRFFKDQFLEPRMEEYRKRGTGEIATRMRRPSTEELSDEEYALFLTQVEAFAVVELGVEFQEEGYP